ncbi:ephrin type-B receptor 6 isoform X1 [Ornithorhynchus anatinus]|uniref:receptor protein-tyrosine kinase n=1 Tax=Ornithorhynchus anatinus TaxID=9258 RepID=F7DSW8_ORNAN|nr:ephrin type-B receptor 6 isoform X1 [Ornithorhynchus anatinus]XP_039767200.1 ephrin type-B receptor 6 isoform X1 [Ornithorhynchus anatinus]
MDAKKPTRVAGRGQGMWAPCLRLCLWALGLLPPTAALEEMLLDTTGVTSEIGWFTYPPGSWDEVSVLDDQRRPARTFEACHVAGPGGEQDNWLRTHFVERRGAQRAHVRLLFSVRACASLGAGGRPAGGPTCRETFTLYYRQADGDGPTGPAWHRGPWTKVDTIAADESFPAPPPLATGAVGAVGAGGGAWRRPGLGLNIKERGFGPLSQRGFYLAFQDTGACLSLVAVQVFAYKCPAVLHAFATFPETRAGGEQASLVEAAGTCVEQAEPEAEGLPGGTGPGPGSSPRLHCNGEGEWMVPVGRCRCRPGFQPAAEEQACLACPVGSFKAAAGDTPCTPCPPRSQAPEPGTPICPCLSGFFRPISDPPDAPCTGPPSAPQDLRFEIQGSAVLLHWRLPLDLGGRGDVVFNVVCKECEGAACRRCGDGVRFDPRQRGLSESRVLVAGLRPHVPYTLEVQAVNGVSELSPDPPQATPVNVTTSHAVPSAVPVVHQVSRAADSITVSWPQPDQPNGLILDYQLRYCDQADDEASSSTLTSETNVATVAQLSPGHVYAFQVRARSAAGHGPYGGKAYFQTLPRGELSHLAPERLPLVVGSALGALAFLALAAVAILTLVFKRKRRPSVYSERLQHRISSRGLGVKHYIDPSIYEDPSQAVCEFAREVDAAQVKIEEVIGTGSFGEVCRGRLQPVGRREQAVAIQTLRAGWTEGQRRAFLARASLLAQFQHPNILRLEAVVTKSRPLMVLTELMEHGPLDSFLRQREGQFSVLQLVSMQRGVAAALLYLSGRGFVHRALAAHSVLVNGHLVCKVARLGHGPSSHKDGSPPSSSPAPRDGRPSPRWAAPEVVSHGKFTSASDVWSFGVIMWEVMSYGERPYWDMSDQEVLTAVGQEFRLPPPPGCPAPLHLLMLDTWHRERVQRPRFDQLVAALDKMIRKPDGLKASVDPGDRPSQPLLSPSAPDFPSLETPQAWLQAIGMERYQDNFAQAGLGRFEDVARLKLEDLQALGITLAGHQKKLLHSVHLLQLYLSRPGSVEV